MAERELLNALLKAQSLSEAKAALDKYQQNSASKSIAFGRSNNSGTIDVAGDPARSIIERITNAHDALLEMEHTRDKGSVRYMSPRAAAAAWFGVPEKKGLSGLSAKQRQDMAKNTILRLEPGEGPESRIVTVIDKGIGIPAGDMQTTILSLNQSNKIQKLYLAGTYGQGGASTLNFSEYVLIASRFFGSGDIAFTAAWYEELPPEQYKTGRYVYLTNNGQPLVIKANSDDWKHGTLIRHFGYDLTGYSATIGPKSLYGALQRLMFDPVSPIWLENTAVARGQNRTIKGARNALNGAVDHGDESSSGPALDHSVPLFNVSLGEFGNIEIEYWVLSRKDGKNQKPSRSFVDDSKPIVLTHNGQNQAEMSGKLIRKDADLSYLQAQGRLILHVNCDRLSPDAKRKFFISTRESSKEGQVKSAIEREIVSLLKADDDLRRLNDEAREKSHKDRDSAAKKQIRRRAARMLRLAGRAVVEIDSGGNGNGEGGSRPRPPVPTPDPIVLQEPPTYIKIIWKENTPISFSPGQRRYIRIETDAHETYRKNILPIIGNGLEVVALTPLAGGRMRIGIEAKKEIAIGAEGRIRIELTRADASVLSDEKKFVITEHSQTKGNSGKTPFPEFETIPVDGPDDDNWDYVAGDNNDEGGQQRDVRRHASGAQMNGGTLDLYYSTHFPSFAAEKKRLEQQKPDLAQSFQAHYELWLALHALLKQEEDEPLDADEKTVSEASRQERCRMAAIAAMIAGEAVKRGDALEEDDSD